MPEPTGAPAGSDKGEDKGGANPPEGYISKQEHEKSIGDLTQQLEDLKLEVVTPEYIQFLEGKKAPAPEKKEEKQEELNFEGMTPGQVYKKAMEDAAKISQKEVEKVRNEFNSSNQASVKKEIEAFARVTPDFDKYRLLMQGISTQTKYRDYTLPELYKAAKEYAKGFGATDDEKDKSRRAGGEKPGSSTPSHKKDKAYTADSAAEEAWGEVVGEGGLTKTE